MKIFLRLKNPKTKRYFSFWHFGQRFFRDVFLGWLVKPFNCAHRPFSNAEISVPFGRQSQGKEKPGVPAAVGWLREGKGVMVTRGFVPGRQGNISTTFRYPWMRSQDFHPQNPAESYGIFEKNFFLQLRVYFGSQFGDIFLVPFPLRFSAVGWHSTLTQMFNHQRGGETNTQTPAKLMSQICPCDIVV